MDDLRFIVGALQRSVAERRGRGPLVALIARDGLFDLRVPSPAALGSAKAFFGMLRAAIEEFDASAVGVVLPVRTLWGEEVVCDYLDAEALAIVGVEVVEDGVGSVGIRCWLHELPGGWEEAHDRLQSISRPLRWTMAALVGESLADEDAG